MPSYDSLSRQGFFICKKRLMCEVNFNNFSDFFCFSHLTSIIWQNISKTNLTVLIFCYLIQIFGPYISASIFNNLDFGTFWGPAHCLYCKHHKTASDSLSNWQALSKFCIANIICNDPSASNGNSNKPGFWLSVDSMEN